MHTARALLPGLLVVVFAVPAGAEISCPEPAGDPGEWVVEREERTQPRPTSERIECLYDRPRGHGAAKINAQWSTEDTNEFPWGRHCASELLHSDPFKSNEKRAYVTVIAASGDEDGFKARGSELLRSIEAIASSCGATPPPPPPPAEASVEVTLELEDPGDGQLTPADEAEIRLVVRNTGDERIATLQIGVDLSEELCRVGDPVAEVIRILDSTSGSTACHTERSWFRGLDPGSAYEDTFTIHVADESHPWILSRIVALEPDLEAFGPPAKPIEETGFELGQAVRVRVVGPDDDELHATWVPVGAPGGGPGKLAYPDLRPLVPDPPDATDEELAYYRQGDTYFSHPGNAWVRALALRAARFDEREDARVFPEGDVARVVENVARFVHDALRPKEAQNKLLSDQTLARSLWHHEYGPDADRPEHPEKPFICQEHSLLFGALLRALGIPVREVNIVSQPVFFYPLLQLAASVPNAIGFTDARWAWEQDAASEVFYPDPAGTARWSFWGLFSKEIFHDPQAHYAGWFQAYEKWVGRKIWTGTESRFRLVDDEPRTFEHWQFVEFGDRTTITKASRPPDAAWVAPYVVYAVYSPVAVMVEVEGRRVGADRVVDPATFRTYLTADGGDASGIVRDIPGAYYYPEGLTLHRIASDAEADVTLEHQLIVVPVERSSDRDGHRLLVTGTGDGAYAIRGLDLGTPGSVQPLDGIAGTVRDGQDVEHLGSELVASGPAFAVALLDEHGTDGGDGKGGPVPVAPGIARSPPDGSPTGPDPIADPVGTPPAVAPTDCGRALPAAIRERWLELGGEDGPLGCPAGSPVSLGPSPAGSGGRAFAFQGSPDVWIVLHESGPPRWPGLRDPRLRRDALPGARGLDLLAGHADRGRDRDPRRPPGRLRGRVRGRARPPRAHAGPTATAPQPTAEPAAVGSFERRSSGRTDDGSAPCRSGARGDRCSETARASWS